MFCLHHTNAKKNFPRRFAFCAIVLSSLHFHLSLLANENNQSLSIFCVQERAMSLPRLLKWCVVIRLRGCKHGFLCSRVQWDILKPCSIIDATDSGFPSGFLLFLLAVLHVEWQSLFSFRLQFPLAYLKKRQHQTGAVVWKNMFSKWKLPIWLVFGIWGHDIYASNLHFFS